MNRYISSLPVSQQVARKAMNQYEDISKKIEILRDYYGQLKPDEELYVTYEAAIFFSELVTGCDQLAEAVMKIVVDSQGPIQYLRDTYE